MCVEKIVRIFKKNSFKSIVLYGPTASGKSDLSLKIADAIEKAIIINADSMQVYKEIPIITSQPQSKKKHHLYGIISCNETSFSVARWIDMASKVINKSINNNIIPIIVGGTGMYITSLLNGLTLIPKIPSEISEKIMNELVKVGCNAMHLKLSSVDPIAAAKISKNDPQRIVRALSVFEHTGKRISEWHKYNHKCFNTNSCMKIWLNPKREILYNRINTRFINILENGAVDEAKSLLNNLPWIKYPKAIGLEQIFSYLNGDMSKESLIKIGQQLTRNYAKRQSTWFRNQMNSHDIVI